MQITILCKVVDNFGDIGVVYRLAKQLKKINLENNINLIVDNLESFNKICASVVPGLDFQEVEGLCVYNCNSYDFCHNAFLKNDGELMPVILECFQCGRPDWLEKILFEEKLQRVVHIIMIDYLTAEKYADDFHCLASLTRSARVQKVNFMPGFTEKTGGLVIDEAWEMLPVRNEKGSVLVFTYERNWNALAKSLYQNYKNCGAKVLVAQGRGKESFMAALQNCPNSDFVSELSYLNQTEWDKVMKDCSALVIRGEESMSRACLSGIPFIWHAYPQSDEYQLVKVRALLERMKRHFSDDDFAIIEKVWLLFNSPETEVKDSALEAACTAFFEKANVLAPGFKDFAVSLRKNGDLAANLMTYIKKLDII